MLFDSPKDLVFGEMLVFTNIFGFLGVCKLAPQNLTLLLPLNLTLGTSHQSQN